MIVCSKKCLAHPQPLTLTEDNTVIQKVKNGTLLGLNLSADLKWTSHCDIIVKKASKRLYCLRLLKHLSCPSHLLLQAYRCYIRLILTYAFPAFCNLGEKKKRLRAIEKRAFKIIGASLETNLDEFCRQQCTKLAVLSMNSNHRLHQFVFTVRYSVCRSTRLKSSSHSRLCKTNRFANSLQKFFSLL